jgi:hypothetical protein
MKRKFNQLTGTERAQIIEALNGAQNMQQFLSYLAVVFDLENCTPGTITKKTISSAMVNTVLPMINPTLKQ